MRLQYLPANACWAFVVRGEQIVAVNVGAGEQRLFATRAEAVEAARACGLHVDQNGRVACQEGW
jgi:hypothetical protein